MAVVRLLTTAITTAVVMAVVRLWQWSGVLGPGRRRSESPSSLGRRRRCLGPAAAFAENEAWRFASTNSATPPRPAPGIVVNGSGPSSDEPDVTFSRARPEGSRAGSELPRRGTPAVRLSH
ncbi:hypothetical protein MRX96_010112 [Rhipicephalus microplus]